MYYHLRTYSMNIAFTRTKLTAQLASRSVLLFFLAIALTSSVIAQPVLTVDAASAFEGNSGTTVLKLPVRVTE